MPRGYIQGIQFIRLSRVESIHAMHESMHLKCEFGSKKFNPISELFTFCYTLFFVDLKLHEPISDLN